MRSTLSKWTSNADYVSPQGLLVLYFCCPCPSLGDRVLLDSLAVLLSGGTFFFYEGIFFCSFSEAAAQRAISDYILHVLLLTVYWVH